MTRVVVHKSRKKNEAQARYGNGNAKKAMVLPEWLNLESSESILMFMRKILVPYTLAGKIGTRACSAMTTVCKVLLDYDRLEALESRVSRLEEEKVKKN